MNRPSQFGHKSDPDSYGSADGKDALYPTNRAKANSEARVQKQAEHSDPMNHFAEVGDSEEEGNALKLRKVQCKKSLVAPDLERENASQQANNEAKKKYELKLSI